MTQVEARLPPQGCLGDPCQLVGQRHDRDVAMGAGEKPAQPSPKRRLARRQRWHRCSGAVDEQHPQVFVPSLADAEQLRLAAGRVLLGDEPEPGTKVASTPECGTVTDRRAVSSWRAMATNSPLSASMRLSSACHSLRISMTSCRMRRLIS